MTRMFLIGSFLLLSFSSLSPADTLVDVFDDSLDSQVLNISSSEIEVTFGDTTESEEPKVVKASKPRFVLASFRISGQTDQTDQTSDYSHWTPGNYPIGMVGTDAFFTSNPDEHFYYFAADLVQLVDKTKTPGFKNSAADSQADHHLEKLSRDLTRSAKR